MVLPTNIIDAAKNGVVATVEQWLDGGGDVMERKGPRSPGRFDPDVGATLLYIVAAAAGNYGHYGAEQGRCDIARLLLARGAVVDDIPIQMEGMARPSAENTALFRAALYNRNDMCQLLCEAGADPNHKRISLQGDAFPLWMGKEDPRTVRVLLSFGADPSQKCGVHMLTSESAVHYMSSQYTAENNQLQKARDLREAVRLLADARLLRPRLRAVFALRALCDRGRAAPTSETPSAFLRLVGGGSAPTSRPRTRSAKILASPGLPAPLAHLVCKFWLGSPPRRVRRTPASG